MRASIKSVIELELLLPQNGVPFLPEMENPERILIDSRPIIAGSSNERAGGGSSVSPKLVERAREETLSDPIIHYTAMYSKIQHYRMQYILGLCVSVRLSQSVRSVSVNSHCVNLNQ